MRGSLTKGSSVDFEHVEPISEGACWLALKTEDNATIWAYTHHEIPAWQDSFTAQICHAIAPYHPTDLTPQTPRSGEKPQPAPGMQSTAGAHALAGSFRAT